jgi:hypothetical protein
MVSTHTTAASEGFAETQQATEGGSLREFSDASQAFRYNIFQFRLNGMDGSIGLRGLTMENR